MFDGVGQCKPALMSLLISRWKPSITWQKTLFFYDRQYEQHARRRGEISFSSKVPLFERLSFGSEENELGACVLLIWQGLFYVKSMAHMSTR